MAQNLAWRRPAIFDDRTVEAGHARDLRGILRRRVEILAIAVDVEQHASLSAVGLGLQRAPPVGGRLEGEGGEEFLLLADLDVARRVEAAIADAVAAVMQQLDFRGRSEEHTSELQSLMRISYAVFCLKKKKN